MHHQARGSFYVAWSMGNLVNKDNYLITRTHEIFSIEAPTTNRLVFSSFNFSLNPSMLHSWTIEFN